MSIGIAAGIMLLVGFYYISKKNTSIRCKRDVSFYLEFIMGENKQKEVFKQQEECKEYESDSELSV